MNTQLATVGTLLRKDLRLFGAFAGLIALLHAVTQLPAVMALAGAAGDLIRIGLQLGTVLLILVVCYEDAVVSLKHDWLTRPISGGALLLTKAAFVFLATILPSILGALLQELLDGHSLGESLLASISRGARGDTLVIFSMIMAFAAVTSSLRQAVVVFLAGIAGMGVLTVIFNAIQATPDSAGATSSAWVIERSLIFLLLLAAVSILCVQYRHRHTRAARGIAAGALVAVLALTMSTTWRPVFALQKRLSPDPGSAAAVEVQLAEGCFPARVLDDGSSAVNEATAQLTAQRYGEGHREFAGPGAVAFSTRLSGQGVPKDGLITIGHVAFGWYADDKELRSTRPAGTSSRWMMPVDGQPVADHYWLVSKSELARLTAAPGVETRIDYSLSLLSPKNSVQFLADGSRRHYSGIGYCDASFDRSVGSIAVSCFKPGAQPSLLTARLAGADQSTEVASRGANFTPAVIDFWGGFRHRMTLVARGNDVPQVVVTAYQARDHFDRQIIVPGVLGGPASACPLP
jgi:hypothetical protein